MSLTFMGGECLIPCISDAFGRISGLVTYTVEILIVHSPRFIICGWRESPWIQEVVFLEEPSCIMFCIQTYEAEYSVEFESQ